MSNMLNAISPIAATVSSVMLLLDKDWIDCTLKTGKFDDISLNCTLYPALHPHLMASVHYLRRLITNNSQDTTYHSQQLASPKSMHPLIRSVRKWPNIRPVVIFIRRLRKPTAYLNFKMLPICNLKLLSCRKVYEIPLFLIGESGVNRVVSWT